MYLERKEDIENQISFWLIKKYNPSEAFSSGEKGYIIK